MSSRQTDDIEVLLERLGSLQIMNKALEETYKWLDEEMSVVPAPAMTNENGQAVMPKNIVSDPGWFNGDRTKFEDWWRGIQLFLKSNRVIKTDNRITAILAHLKESIADIHVQKKLDELDKELRTQDWEEFVKEIKTMFSNKTKAADTKWRIESFKQEKKNIADFMIEFEALAMKVNIDKLHVIFLLKKNIQQDIIKIILGYLLIVAPETLKEWKIVIISVGQEYKSTEGQQDYKIGTRTTYGGWG